MDISHYHPAHVLAALYNAARPAGLGFLQAKGDRMTPEEAEAVLGAAGRDIDYLHGRALKVDLRQRRLAASGGHLDLRGYDRDQGGPGAGERAILAACAPRKKRAG